LQLQWEDADVGVAEDDVISVFPHWHCRPHPQLAPQVQALFPQGLMSMKVQA